MFGGFLKWGIILSKTKNMIGFPGILLAFPPLHMRMDMGNSPFLEILDSLAKLQPNIEILDEWDFKIPGSKERTKWTWKETLWLL